MERRWTVKSEEALARSRGLARDKAHPRVTTGHLLAALFEADNFVSLYLRRLGSEPARALARATAYLADLTPDTSPAEFGADPPLDPDLAAALERAAGWADELDDEYVSAENLLLGLAGGDDDIALTLQAAGVGRGGWQGVIRLRRELWERQVRSRPKPPGFEPSVAGVLVEAARRAGTHVVEPAHVLVALVDLGPAGELLGALGLSVRDEAAEIANRATAVAEGVLPPVVSDELYAAVEAARAEAGAADVTPVALLRGLARGDGEVGALLKGVDEMLALLADRVREPASRLAAARMAQRRAMQQADLETAARLLHGEIPVLEQEIEAMGPAEAALVRLSGEQPASAAEPDPAYERFLSALDTAGTRTVSLRLLHWLGERDVPPGDSVELAAFCATAPGGTVTGREAGHAAGRLALLGLIDRDDETVRLTAAGLRCLEDRAGTV